jgi:hypothetical protein
MDPVTVTIVSALAAGAAAAGNEVATDAIKDAYGGLRRLITDRYERIAPFAVAVETEPDSEPEKVLAEQLDQAGAARDEALKAAACALLAAMEALRSDTRAQAVFDFDVVRALKNFELEDIETGGTVLRSRDATFEGDFKAKGIRQRPAAGNAEKY